MNLQITTHFTGAEKQYLEGAQGKKLTDCTDGDIKQLLAYCCIMTGIQKPPADEQKVVIIAFLRKYFGTVTTAWLAHAFELLAKGDLGREVQEHYNCISPQYISGALRAYFQKFGSVANRYRRRKTACMASEASSPAAYYNKLIQNVEKYKVIPLFWAWDDVYHYLAEPQDNKPSSIGKEMISPEKKKEFVLQFLKAKYPGAIEQKLDLRAERKHGIYV